MFCPAWQLCMHLNESDHPILGSSKKLEKPFSKFQYSLYLFPTNIQQKTKTENKKTNNKNTRYGSCDF